VENEALQRMLNKQRRFRVLEKSKPVHCLYKGAPKDAVGKP